jgi:hypothetical protein
MDEKLPFKNRLGVKMHLMVCKWCRRYAKQIHLMNNLVHKHIERLESGIPDSGTSLSAGTRDKINQALKNNSQ